MSQKQLFDLRGKVCLVTGGAGLLGQAFSTALAVQGATTLIVDVNQEAGEKVVKKIRTVSGNKQVFFYTCDITSPKEIKVTLKIILTKHKKIDALVNNAYPRNKNYGRKFENVTYEDFCENVGMHLGGYFAMTQAVTAVMKKQRTGAVINLGSIYGFTAPKFEIYTGTDMTTPVEYAAIKGAVVNLTKYLASYLGKYNIRVNTLSPGGVANKQPDIFVQKYSERVPLGNRMAIPEDLIGALIFLISDASRYITGQNIVVDGGWTL